MRVAVFSTKPYDRRWLEMANGEFGHHMEFLEVPLDARSARLAEGFGAVCIFVNDRVDAAVLTQLHAAGVRIVALRCAGFNNVDVEAADRLGIAVVRVPAYSPAAVAEFTLGLILALERKIPRAWSRVRENNFALDGLIGRNLAGRVAGVIGTGRIGARVALALRLGLGCDVLASDPVVVPALVEAGICYVTRDQLLADADLVTLHCPLTPDTRHLVDARTIAAMRPGVTIVNTSRGALIDTAALVAGLKSRKIGGVALDVYEEEDDLFFEDLSSEIIQDDVFQRLLTFPNVIVTGHQGFLTEEALTEIARQTLESLADAEAGRPLLRRVAAAEAGGV
jgi:D-lactate dehydrogenase